MLDGVPTAEELVQMGLATRVQRGASSFIQIHPEGHALLGQKLREAAERNGPLEGERLKEVLRRKTDEQRDKHKRKRKR